MTDFLLLRLYGPMASWGVTAVGETRPTQDYPGRGAVLGLLGACLGVPRDDAEAQAALAEGYGLAVRIDAHGVPMEDFHTVQMPRAKRRFAPPTRRAELIQDQSPIETVISRRTYLADALSVVALWTREGARWSLAELADALRQPKFMPYLGRKSCPLALPPLPWVGAAEGILDALAQADESWARADRAAGLGVWGSHLDRPGLGRQLVWDADLPGLSPGGDVSITPRRDQPVDRPHWQFMDRDEHAMWLSPDSESAPRQETP